MSICWSYSTSKHLQSKPLGMIACCGQLIECVLVYGSSDSMMGMHFTKWVAIVWNKTFSIIKSCQDRRAYAGLNRYLGTYKPNH